jgi:hypothetical protein
MVLWFSKHNFQTIVFRTVVVVTLGIFQFFCAKNVQTGRTCPSVKYLILIMSENEADKILN